jgi:hypothetical protein
MSATQVSAWVLLWDVYCSRIGAAADIIIRVLDECGGLTAGRMFATSRANHHVIVLLWFVVVSGRHHLQPHQENHMDIS